MSPARARLGLVGRAWHPGAETEDNARRYCGPWDGGNVGAPGQVYGAHGVCAESPRAAAHQVSGTSPSPSEPSPPGTSIALPGHQAVVAALWRFWRHGAPHAVGASPVSQYTAGPEQRRAQRMPRAPYPHPACPRPYTPHTPSSRRERRGRWPGVLRCCGSMRVCARRCCRHQFGNVGGSLPDPHQEEHGWVFIACVFGKENHTFKCTFPNTETRFQIFRFH